MDAVARRTPRELDALASRLIAEAGGFPSFLGYRDYPAATCISVFLRRESAAAWTPRYTLQASPNFSKG